MRIRDWSSDVCSSDLHRHHQSWPPDREQADARACQYGSGKGRGGDGRPRSGRSADAWLFRKGRTDRGTRADHHIYEGPGQRRRCAGGGRSEEHTSELQSLMRISYAVFCLKKKKYTINNNTTHSTTKH